MNLVLERPKQKVSQGTKNTKNWQENNVNYWIGRCNTTFFNFKDLITLYKAAAGILDEADYTYITNPLSTTNNKLKGYPAKMRNVDIISQNIQTLMGELASRYFNPQVVCLNEDVENRQYDEQFQIRLQYLKQEFVNSLVQQGMAPEELAQQQDPESVKKKLNSNLKAEYSKIGQNAIDYIMQFNEVHRIRSKTFYDFIVASRFFTFRDVLHEDTEYEYVSPFELSYVASPNVDFIEDADSVTRSVKMSISQIIDRFSGMEGFTDDIIVTLEKNIASVTLSDNYNPQIAEAEQMLSRLFNTNNLAASQDGILIQHTQWTSMAKVYKVKGIAITGEEYEYEVDESYVFSDDETYTEYWINQKWEGYRIASEYIVGVQALPHQRGRINNPSKCKNSYNGRVFGNNYIIPQSIVEKGMIYQTKYNVVHYLMEKMLAKNKDKMTIYPLGLIPEKEGMDMFSVMYYADAHGFLFVDESNPNAVAAMQYMKTVDMSLSQYIKDVYGILQSIKQDWDDAVGISRQRRGQTMASDGKAVNEEAIYRSSLTSEEFFRQHEDTIIKDLQCLVDISKVAWRNGKKSTFLTSDFKLADLNIDPTVYQYLDLGVFVKNSGQEKQKVDALRQQIGTIAQQTQNFSILAKILNSNNLAQITEQMEELENRLEESAKQQQQAEQALEQAKIEDKEKDRQLSIYKIDEDNDTKLDVALIGAEATVLGFGVGEEGTNDALQLEEFANKRLETATKFSVEREKIAAKREEVNKKAQTETKNMKNDLEIEKIRLKAAKAKKPSK